MLMRIVKFATYHQEIRNFVLLHTCQSLCSEKHLSLLDASNFADGKYKIKLIFAYHYIFSSIRASAARTLFAGPL